MNALFSIKPQYAQKIFEGSKWYEFRKVCCKQPIGKIYIYETYPICAIMGECVVTDVLQESPRVLWNRVSENAGIPEKEYFQYFEGHEKAVAYKLEHIIQYTPPKKLQDFNFRTPPQSFYYIRNIWSYQQVLRFFEWRTCFSKGAKHNSIKIEFVGGYTMTVFYNPSRNPISFNYKVVCCALSLFLRIDVFFVRVSFL